MNLGIEECKKMFFYSVVKLNTIIKCNDNVSWVLVFEGENNEKIGITQMGIWTFNDNNKFYLLNEQKKYLYTVKLLEYSYDLIEKKITDKFSYMFDNQELCVSDIFPFYEIVAFAFEFMNNDYWIELGWNWYDKLNIYEKNKLIYLLENIVNNKRFSQKNRQKARKEINNVKFVF